MIAKGGPSKKAQNKEALKKATKEANERQKILDGLERINMLELDGRTSESSKSDKKKRQVKSDNDGSDASHGTRLTTASFASVWSNCTNNSLNEFFQVWNPNLETHKDALAVIAGLSQTMSASGTEQSDMEFAKVLFNILSSSEAPSNVLTGALLVLTFIMRKLPSNMINENFDFFHPILKNLMEAYHDCKKKTLIKCLLRCFAYLTKAHPLGKEAIESSLRKKINIAIRQYKVQDKIRL